jgi:dynein heavy chain, axonemal
MAQMQRVSKYEIAEVKNMHHPPRLVKLVMKAICILLDVEPTLKTKKDGKQKLSYWRAALSNQVLNDP